MTWPTIHRIRLVQKKRRRLVLRLCAIAVVLLALLPLAQPAHADTGYTNPGCSFLSPSAYTSGCLPPALLSLSGLYSATPTQADALQSLETQAISNTLTDHGLPASDADAVKSWARADADAELFVLLDRAVTTNASARTTVQQNAVDWISAVQQREAQLAVQEATAAAQDAGLEYVKWAGLDTGTYQSLLNSSTTTQSDFQTFLCGGDCSAWQATVLNYNNPNPSQATGGYCVYRSPAPYGSEYTGYNDPTCFAPCSNVLGCTPPTPTYDQFVKWGQADGQNDMQTNPQYQQAALQSSAQYVQAGSSIAAGLIFGGSVVGAGVSGVAVSSGLAEALVGSTLQEAIFPYAAAVGEDVAAEVGVDAAVGTIAASAGAVAGIVIAAIAIAVIQGINVANAAALPGKLATLIANARATAPDPATVLNDPNSTSSLFSLFVGATLPIPQNQSCDNSSPIPPGVTVGGGFYGQPPFPQGYGVAPCLNPTPIPPASDTDPQFLVQARGATTQTSASTLTWKDTAVQSTLAARVSGDWFIVQNGSTTVQSLSIAYTDWSGNEQVAWLVDSPTAGYQFVGYNATAGKSTAIDPATCRASGVCWSSSSIDYVGSDGNDYAASVEGYTPPTGSPSYSTPVEGSPVTFNANDYAPGGATAPITYTWEFQQTGCGEGFGTGSSSSTVLCQNWSGLAQFGIFPDYTAPVTSTTATHTYPTSGQYLVRLTATDATGKQAVDTFTVAVGDMPPTLNLDPACPAPSPALLCNTQSGDAGTVMTLHGTISHAGTQDSELVLVNWGDGSDEDIASAGSIPILLLQRNPLTLTPDASQTGVTFSDTHTYATGGSYHVTVSVFDQGGGTDSKTAIETINNPAPTTRGVDLTSAAPAGCAVLAGQPPSIIPPAPAVAAIGSSPAVTITGSGFVPGSTAQWNGSPLATTYVSPCQLTAQVPATDTASAAVGALTVVNAAPGGGTSNPQLVYITPDGTLAGAALATSSSVGGSATATVGGHSDIIGGVGQPGTPGTLSATASGAGAVAVAQYNTDPLTTTPPSAVNAYFDVFVPAGSSFSSVQVTDCNLGGGSVVYYDDATTGQWTKVSGQSYDAGTGCVTFTLNATSTPGLTQLSGTDFGVQNVPPVVTNPGAQSARYGSQASIPVSATDVEAADKLTLHASGLPAGLSLRDNGDGTGTISGTVTAPAGVYTATLSANDGYSDSTPVTVPFTITPAPLSITANNKSTTYGGSVPSFDAGYSGLVNGDSSGVVSGLTCGATDRQGHPVSSDTPVGTYTITCSGGSAANYSISYVTGTLTINPAPLSITANDQTMLLHGAVPALSASYSGFVNGETASALSTAPTCTTTATSSSSVGSYPITCGGAVDANYAISYQPGTLKVLYKWSGFGQPISDPAAGATSMSVFKAGSTVPVKFQLEDANGAVVQAGSLPTFAVSAPQSCAAGSVDASGTTTTGDTGTTYRWDSTAQQYAYNYHTSSTLAGQCQSITATLDDGTTQSVQVAYK